MADNTCQTLIYRGNFSLRRRKDYSNAFLEAEYPNGYASPPIVIGRPLRSWDLTYSALVPAMVNPPNALPKDRLSYVWDFFCDSKDNGNRPFILICPADNKKYLCVFQDSLIEVEMMNYMLSTTGLVIKQRFVKDLNFLDDGSMGDATNPNSI